MKSTSDTIEKTFGLQMRIEYLSVDDMQVDPAYQRLVKTGMAKKIAASLNMCAFGVLIVGRRVDGTYWVVDGQTRLSAARRANLHIVPCSVFESTGPVLEAQVFRLANERTNLRQIEAYKAALTGGDPETVAIEEMVSDCGFQVSDNKGRWPGIKAVSSLRVAYRNNVLYEVLTAIRLAYERATDDIQTSATQGYMIDALRFAFVTWGNQIDQRRLVAVLAKLNPRNMYAAAGVYSGNRAAQIGERLILVEYNKGLRSNRLERPSN